MIHPRWWKTDSGAEAFSTSHDGLYFLDLTPSWDTHSLWTEVQYTDHCFLPYLRHVLVFTKWLVGQVTVCVLGRDTSSYSGGEFIFWINGFNLGDKNCKGTSKFPRETLGKCPHWAILAIVHDFNSPQNKSTRHFFFMDPQEDPVEIGEALFVYPYCVRIWSSYIVVPSNCIELSVNVSPWMGVDGDWKLFVLVLVRFGEQLIQN